MCGVFGVINASAALDRSDLVRFARALLLASEIRGSEAAGIVMWSGSGVVVGKSNRPAHEFVKDPQFLSAMASLDQVDEAIVVGHARLVTNGSAIYRENNQPVSNGPVTLVHNGIVTNFRSLGIHDEGESDSAALAAHLDDLVEAGHSIESAVALLFSEINGSASVAVIEEGSGRLVIATNTGSLYVAEDDEANVVAFGSELRIMRRALRSPPGRRLGRLSIRNIPAGSGVSINRFTGRSEEISLGDYRVHSDSHFRGVSPVDGSGPLIPADSSPTPSGLGDVVDIARSFAADVRRCSRCILPSTVPFITFDDDGVCSLCTTYTPRSVRDPRDLDRELDSVRSREDGPNCIVAFSGGRDSSYGLHLLVREHGLRPVALTYDWGMVTDLARRNQARMTGALGVEHILVSADIARKRRNIGQNLEAWLRRPHLGMVPLLMAGDKQFFLHAERLARESGIPLVVFCINPWEATFFKAGFAGVPDQGYYTSSTFGHKVSIFGFYGGQFLRNKAYLNSSLVDTLQAAGVTYLRPHRYLQLFDWIDWDEDEVNSTLTSEYGWETDPSTTTTWRIGDGTAPFYNYVYWRTVGFTESDTFRSNQVREGRITRDRALELATAENEPRWSRIQEYLDLVGVDFDHAMSGIERLAARSPVGA